MKKWYTISGEVDKRGRGKNTKRVPRDLKLTPIVLAYWIAGDGCFNKVSKTLTLCTNNFTEEELEWLSKNLYKTFNINSKIVLRKKTSNSFLFEPMLFISRLEMNKVYELIQKLLFKSFWYKLGL